ncbi:MAG: GNAT family N-acetyltransferase [Thalassovita sp.]|nr:GNAT family N-acetyltransferase [Thalassovita sp.]
MLQPGYHDVPAGHLAAVVTHLEMRARPELRPETDCGLSLRRFAAPDPDWYRALYRRVGADWLWFSRLEMHTAELGLILNDPKNHVYVAEKNGEEAGLLELDFRREGDCELAFFGLAADYIGTGAGRWLMNRAIEKAWAEPINRLHVHTCTLDHPAALDFYRRSGFTPVRRQIEIAPDPRLRGTLPETAAPQIPILR